MADLLIRDLPQATVDALERRAAEHGRSAELESRSILEAAVNESGKVEGSSDIRAFWDEARKLREELRGRAMPNSTDLLREDRDNR